MPSLCGRPFRVFVIADLLCVAMYHLRKAMTAAARDDFSSKPLDFREALMGAMNDAGSVLGDYARAMLGVYSFSLEAYLPHLLDVMDKLDVACRAIGANLSTYRGFRRSLLGQQPPAQWYPPPPPPPPPQPLAPALSAPA